MKTIIPQRMTSDVIAAANDFALRMAAALFLWALCGRDDITVIC